MKIGVPISDHYFIQGCNKPKVLENFLKVMGYERQHPLCPFLQSKPVIDRGPRLRDRSIVESFTTGGVGNIDSATRRNEHGDDCGIVGKGPLLGSINQGRIFLLVHCIQICFRCHQQPCSLCFATQNRLHQGRAAVRIRHIQISAMSYKEFKARICPTKRRVNQGRVSVSIRTRYVNFSFQQHLETVRMGMSSSTYERGVSRPPCSCSSLWIGLFIE
mmetsp:Transcript_36680/g.70719  ORF Transcript_36680/g.70719 Transcript_36680/m.70719 type:complete len:217 (-) Transcript_36680:1484-2134(-)